MDLGAYQLQIFLSLFVVLGAAFVALVCDLLHGNNEQLRVLNTELKVRREEEQKRFEILEKAEAKRQESAAEATAAVEALVERNSAERNGPLQRVTERKRAPAPEALAAMERGVQMAALPWRRPQASESVEVPAMAAIADTAVVHSANQETQLMVERLVAQAAENTFAKGVEIRSAQAVDAATNGPAIGSRDWSSLLNRRATSPAPSESGLAASAPASNDLLAAVVAATDSNAPAQPSPTVPPGFQDGFVLSRLVEGRQPISGLVVSIAVVAQASNNDSENIPSSVSSLLESLLGSSDFATQSGKEEYLLIYPGLRGAAAQRRLSEIRQQLSDFQVRSAGQYAVQLNWGGEETRSESIERAIASAAERMSETRRSPRVLAMDSDMRAALPKAG